MIMKKSTNPPPPPFPGAKLFFQVKSENTSFLHEKNMQDFSLIIAQDISNKK